MSTKPPRRVRRQRTKGFKLPPNTCCVTRPGRWGNPYETAEQFRLIFIAIRSGFPMSRKMLASEEYQRMKYIVENVTKLRGWNLACFCSLDKSCHADTLLYFANRDE